MNDNGHSSTRYNPVSNPPPALASVLKVLAKKASRTQGVVSTTAGNERLRALVTPCSADYKRPGKADDTARFLRTWGIVIALTQGKPQYFDADRAEEVLQAVDEGKNPPPSADPAERIAAIKARYAQQKKVVSTTAPATSPPLNPRALTPETVEFELPEDASELTVVACVGIYASITHWVLYLTPLEQAAWDDIILRVGKVGDDDRVGVPNSDFALDSSWGPINQDYDRDAYLAAFGRLVGYGIVEYVGDGKPTLGKGVFRLRVCPDHVTTVAIEERYPLSIPRAYANIVRAVQSGMFHPTTWKRGWGLEFESWATGLEPELKGNTISRKICYNDINPDAKDAIARGNRADGRGGWGILRIVGEQPYVCWPGFEPFAFMAMDEAPRRRDDHRGRVYTSEELTSPAPTEVIAEPPAAASPPPPMEATAILKNPKAVDPPVPEAQGLDELDAEERKLQARLAEIRKKKADIVLKKRQEIEERIAIARRDVEDRERSLLIAKATLAKLEEELAALPK